MPLVVGQGGAAKVFALLGGEERVDGVVPGDARGARGDQGESGALAANLRLGYRSSSEESNVRCNSVRDRIETRTVCALDSGFLG